MYMNLSLMLGNFCLKLSHATCLQLDLYCVNQAHNSPTRRVACLILRFTQYNLNY
jgi:hypothetical protein